MWVIKWSLPWVSFWTSLCGNKRAAYICIICQIIINYPENQPHHESQSHFASPCASKIFMVAWSWQHHTTHRFVHVFVVAHPIVGVGKIKICVRDKARIDTSLVGVNINGWASEILTSNRKPQYFFCEQTVVSRWFSQINDPNEKS